MKTFKVSVITPSEKLYDKEADSLYLASEIGYLQILADHAPLLANTVSGKVVIKNLGQKYSILATGKGFLEVLNNKVTLLLEAGKALDNS